MPIDIASSLPAKPPLKQLQRIDCSRDVATRRFDEVDEVDEVDVTSRGKREIGAGKREIGANQASIDCAQLKFRCVKNN